MENELFRDYENAKKRVCELQSYFGIEAYLKKVECRDGDPIWGLVFHLPSTSQCTRTACDTCQIKCERVLSEEEIIDQEM